MEILTLLAKKKLGWFIVKVSCKKGPLVAEKGNPGTDLNR